MLNRRTLIATLAVVPLAAVAKSIDPVYTTWLSNDAVQGYDPVAYFSLAPGAEPVKGEKAYHVEWQGADWYFASQQNLDTFKANPNRYAPRYGGYCAWAIAEGDTAKGDARHWAIVRHNADGSIDTYPGSGDDTGFYLYLNYDASVQKRWEADVPGFITKADQNWTESYGLSNPY